MFINYLLKRLIADALMSSICLCLHFATHQLISMTEDHDETADI